MMRAPRKDSKNGWSVAQFERERPRLTDFIKANISPLLDSDECRRVLIEAPVKSGKREMVEYIAMRDEAHNPTRVHAFISAFHRIADESQRAELKRHNLEIFSLTKKTDVDRCIHWIESNISSGKHVVLHIDECDFGSGSRQILNRIYKRTRDDERVTIIMYSATPQEVLFSGEIEKPDYEDDDYQEMMGEMIQTGIRVLYEPPPSFCGPARFLDAGLIMDATPFFYKNSDGSLGLSNQGVQIMADLRISCMNGLGRNILFLRLSYSEFDRDQSSKKNKKENKAIHQFVEGLHTIPELADCIIYADKTEKDMPGVEGILLTKIQWSNKMFWNQRTDKPVIVIVDQTCSRSTELACHDRLFAIHDYRNRVTFSTSSQADERVNHYPEKYGGEFQPIRVYAHKKTFELSARRITYEEYLAVPLWDKKKVCGSSAKLKELGEACYNIQSSYGNRENHPSYPDPMTKEQADRVLQEICCSASVEISSRVIGGISRTHEYVAEFFECSKDSFKDLKVILASRYPGRSFQNPFIKSEAEGKEDGRYKGYLRRWRVFDFDADIETQPGCGVTSMAPRLTICYRDGVEGVALRYDTGKIKEVNTLVTCKSMYKR